MSQPTGFYRKKDRFGRDIVHPITGGNAGGDYVEPEMQVQQVKHKEDPMKVALRLAIKGGQKADESITDKVREYKETHTPEALVAREEAKVRAMEAQQQLL